MNNLFFSSCDKDKNDFETTHPPLIASVLKYNMWGNLSFSESYHYDNQGRLIKIDDNNNNTYSTLEYSSSTIIIKKYGNGELTNTSIANLNNNGLCTSVTSVEFNELETYEYDDDGYRRSIIYEDDTIWHTSTFTVSEENYVTNIYKVHKKNNNIVEIKGPNFLSSSFSPPNFKNRFATVKSLKSAPISYIRNTDFQFYKNHVNTIDYENIGLSFFGKQNKNPIKIKINSFENDYLGIDTISYLYEYDRKGRITRQRSNDVHYYYSVYTYVD